MMALGRAWRDVRLLDEALTHPSAANELRMCSNQRLEFLGDAVLDLVVADRLMTDQPGWDEGRLSIARGELVCEGNLARVGRSRGIDRLVRLGRGAELQGLRGQPGTVADAVEALVGAAYSDGGLDAAAGLISWFGIGPACRRRIERAA